ncbi:hypothetical protein [Xanthomonas phage JGB6]|nr:hypothetical protein [Xanthomonas phage JGB6]
MAMRVSMCATIILRQQKGYELVVAFRMQE